MDDIDKLLAKTEKPGIIHPRDLIPQVVPFTKGAYHKAELIGPIIQGLTKKDYEWSGFLLARKGDPKYIVRDILIQEGQDIQFHNVEIEGKDIAKANDKVQRLYKDLYVIGWIHGHGNVSFLSPSKVDQKNFDIVLNSVGLNTERSIDVLLNLIETDVIKKCENGKIIYSGKALEDATIEYILPSQDEKIKKILKQNGFDLKDKKIKENASKILETLLEEVETKFYQPNIFGFSYFVIMSNKTNTKPYAAIKLCTEKGVTKEKSSELIEDLDVEKIKIHGDIKITKTLVEEEVKANIELPKSTTIWKKIFTPPYTSTGKLNYSYYTPSYTKWNFWIENDLIESLEKRISKYESAGKNVPDAKVFLELLKALKNQRDRTVQEKLLNIFFESMYGPIPNDTHEEEEIVELLEKAQRKNPKNPTKK